MSSFAIRELRISLMKKRLASRQPSERPVAGWLLGRLSCQAA
jgi:hypothetical protein